MGTKERIANSISHDALLAIKGVADVEDPVELNALILVMKGGTKYRLTIEEEIEEHEEERNSYYYSEKTPKDA